MTTEETNKMFEGRWRVKGFDTYEVRQLSGDAVKRLCRDFFEAGILLASGDTPTTQNEAPGASTSFETFWSIYEKKVGRFKCEKLWSKLKDDEKQACLSYIPFYKQSQPDKQYRKNPETFLRNKAWNDELIYRQHAATHQPTIEQQRARKLADILTD